MANGLCVLRGEIVVREEKHLIMFSDQTIYFRETHKEGSQKSYAG